MPFTAADVKRLREKTGAGVLDCQKALKEADGVFEEAETILKKMGLAAVAKRSDRVAEQGRIFTAIIGNRAAILEIGCETDFVARNDEFIATGKMIVEQAAKENLTADAPAFQAAITNIAATIKENITLRRLELLEIGPNEAADTYIHGDAGSVGVVVKFKLSKADLAANPAVRTFMHDCALHGAAFKPPYLTGQEVNPADIAKQTEIFAAQLAEDKKPDEVKKKIIEGKLKTYLADICFLEQPFVKDNKKSLSQIATEVGKAAGGTVDLVAYRIYQAGEAL